MSLFNVNLIYFLNCLNIFFKSYSNQSLLLWLWFINNYFLSNILFSNYNQTGIFYITLKKLNDLMDWTRQCFTIIIIIIVVVVFPRVKLLMISRWRSKNHIWNSKSSNPKRWDTTFFMQWIWEFLIATSVLISWYH